MSGSVAVLGMVGYRRGGREGRGGRGGGGGTGGIADGFLSVKKIITCTSAN